MVLALITVGGLYWFFEPRYEAAALLEINEPVPYIAFGPRDAWVSDSYFRTQVEIIKSRWILGRTVASTAVKELPEIRKQADPIDWVQERISLARPNNSNVFGIRYASRDAKAPRWWSTKSRGNTSSRKKRRSRCVSATFLRPWSRNLRNAENTVKTLREQMAHAENIPPDDAEVPCGEETPVFKNPVAELQSRLAAVQVERAMKAASIEALQEDIKMAETAPAKRQSDGKPCRPIPLRSGRRSLSD